MRTLFIGLFIIAFLAGIAAKTMNMPLAGQKSWVGHLLSMVGLQHKDESEKAQFNEIVHHFDRDKTDFTQYIKDQQQYLEDSQLQMSSLTQSIKDKLDRSSNMDLLRLRDLMKQYQDQNSLLIEHGKELIRFNQEQMNLRQKLVQDRTLASMESNSGRDRFMQNLRENLERQRDLMSQRVTENDALSDRIQQIKDQTQKMHDSVALKENPQFLEKLKDISEKTKSVLDRVKEQRERLQDMNQRNLADISLMKEKMENLKQRTVDLVGQNRARMQDQQQLMQDRVNDQMKRAKELGR